MTEHERNNLDDQQFDQFLQDMTQEPPPAELESNFKPWAMAMERILFGIGFTTIKFNFLYLDILLPAMGMVMIFLGFRSLRRENHWFRMAYLASALRLVWWLAIFCLDTTIYAAQLEEKLQTVGLLMLLPQFLTLLGLRNGIRTVQHKAGLSAHGGTGLLVCYLVTLVLALWEYAGILGWVLPIAYILLLRGLYSLSKELDEAGYNIHPSPVTISDLGIKQIYAAVLVLAVILGYGFFGKYPMDWQAAEETSSDLDVLCQELLDLGMPQDVLEDLSEEEILACQGAELIMVDVQEYDMAESKRVNAYENPPGTPQLQTTDIAIRFSGQPERWKIIHHFRWLIDDPFVGTEALKIDPSEREEYQKIISDITGRVLYDQAGQTMTASYYSLEAVTYEVTGVLASMMGQTQASDLYAAFSYPRYAENARCYILYDMEKVPGGSIDSWCNYIHQRSRLQFPVRTAIEYDMGSHQTYAPFQTIFHALQMTTHTDTPAFFGNH